MPSTPSHSENSEDSEQSHNSEESEDSEPSHNFEISVHEGHVALVLLPVEGNPGGSNFYLEIPIDIINSLCLRPRKYLRYLGWCILGNTGKLSFARGGEEIDDPDGGVQDREVYYYVMNGIHDLRRAVDLEVIRARDTVASESTITRVTFRDQLVRRDVLCVWTGLPVDNGVGLHIIPFKRGDQWIRLITLHRPGSRDRDTELVDNINDIRNGLFANLLIHSSFDRRHIACLRTPNHVLGTEDIPQRHDRLGMDARVTYPTGIRYTLQWLKPQNEVASAMTPNNSDATFRRNTRLAKPSDILLHYTYGAAAIKCWGKGTGVLQGREGIPRPSESDPAGAGPSRTKHDRTVVRRKLEKHRNRGGGKGSAAGAGTGGVVEPEGQAEWDEDDVMLFLWGNSLAAEERHVKEVAEKSEQIERWRGGVSQESV